jgi:hypothetical protein
VLLRSEIEYSVNRYLKFFLAVMVISGACDQGDEVETNRTPDDYLPLKKGRYQIYDVTETTYELGVPQTLTYELKTVVVDSFVNAPGYYSYVIHRSFRNAGATLWTYQNTWSASTTGREATIQEQNIPYLKFRVPLVEGLEWNGNIYNAAGEDTYELENLHATETFGAETFDDCITVNQNDNQDYIVFFDQRKEVYARNVGLIHKETTQLHYCTQQSSGCLGQQVIEEGFVYQQTIKAHGVE